MLKKLINQEKYDRSIWLFTHPATERQNVGPAIYSARLSLANYEAVYPEDKRPRKTIAAVEKWRKNPTEGNRKDAESARSAALSAADSALSAAHKRICNYAINVMRS